MWGFGEGGEFMPNKTCMYIDERGQRCNAVLGEQHPTRCFKHYQPETWTSRQNSGFCNISYWEVGKHRNDIWCVLAKDHSGNCQWNKDLNHITNYAKEKQPPPSVKQFETGAVRSGETAQGNKTARYDLISSVGLRRIAETYGEGAIKYGDHNWRKGIPLSNIMNHAIAHIVAYLSGDSSEDHLAHAAWNIIAAMETEELRPQMNDLYFRAKDES